MKPVWLRIDFDKWKLDDSDEEKEKEMNDEDLEQQINVLNMTYFLFIIFFNSLRCGSK